jgi:hypothetical protein
MLFSMLPMSPMHKLAAGIAQLGTNGFSAIGSIA